MKQITTSSALLVLMLLLLPTLIKAQETPVVKDKKAYEFTMTKEVAHTPVPNQYRSGTCWSFSGVGLLEAEILRKTGKTLDLSEMFVVRNAYSVKAEKYVSPSYSNQFMRAPLSVNMSSSIQLDHPSDNLKEFSWVLDGVLVKDTMRRQLFANLPEGDHTIEFKALSDFGQRALVRHDFTVLKNKPAECDLQQSDTTTSWRVKMSCVDTDGRIVAYRWKIDGETIGNTSYAISLTKALNPGSHEIEAVAIDDSGDETKDSTTLTGQ